MTFKHLPLVRDFPGIPVGTVQTKYVMSSDAIQYMHFKHFNRMTTISINVIIKILLTLYYIFAHCNIVLLFGQIMMLSVVICTAEYGISSNFLLLNITLQINVNKCSEALMVLVPHLYVPINHKGLFSE